MNHFNEPRERRQKVASGERLSGAKARGHWDNREKMSAS